MLPFLGIGDSGTVIVVHQTPTQCGTDLQWNEPHPVSVAHRQNVGEIAMRIRHSQQRLQRLGNPCTMREHVQVRVGSGTERPIVQRFDATTSDFLLGFGTVFEFAATEFSPGTIVFRVPLREFLNRNASQSPKLRSRTRMSGCTSKPSGSANACAVAAARPRSEQMTSRFGISGRRSTYSSRNASAVWRTCHCPTSSRGMSICLADDAAHCRRYVRDAPA